MIREKMEFIQGLRGYAIILIVLWHLNSIFPQNLPSTGDKGVEFFFLISGFLVAYKYLDNDKLSTCRQSLFYAINKVKKLYPLYLLSIIPMFFLDLRLVMKNASGGGRLVGKLTSSILLVQSWIPNSEFYWALNGVTWFLSSLIFCYAMSALTIRWLKKVDNGFVGVLFILMAEFVIEAFAIRFLSQNMCTWLTYICPAFRFLDYSLGMCLFKVYQDFIKNDHSGQKSNNIIPVTILLYLLLAFIGENVLGLYTVYHVFEAALFMFIVCFPCKSRKLVFENKFMVWIGNMSMEIFLTHKIVLSYLSIIWEKVIGTQYPVLEWALILIVIVFTGFCTKFILDRIKRGSNAAQS